jgi:penicillin V acylase-like amidase (Ntn superfamily)
MLVALLWSLSQPVEACTTFLLSEDGQSRVAKSYDWEHEDGMLHHNPAGLKKKALVLREGTTGIDWTSRYGSLTFNQYGREMPNGGINEAGLVVEIMWLNGAEWPAADDRPALNELQWIQYQLDMYGSVKELLAAAGKIRVEPIHGRVHYMACDASGDCASLEYLEGKLVIHHGESLEVPVLTNHTYAQSLDHLRRHEGKTPARDEGSLSRFQRAAERTAGDASADSAWAGLEDVQWSRTRWQIVYDTQALSVQFRTREHPQIRSVTLSDLDPSCAQGTQVLSLQSPHSGPVAGLFQPYDPALNEALVQTGLDELKADLPPQLVPLIAHFHEDFSCTR